MSWLGLGSVRGLGQTQESTLGRAERLCREAMARGGGEDAPWCVEHRRLTLYRGAAAPPVTTEAEAAAERERQAAAERERIARRLEQVDQPVVARTVRQQQDIIYARSRVEAEAVLRRDREARARDEVLAKVRAAQEAKRLAAVSPVTNAPRPISPPLVTSVDLPRMDSWRLPVILGGVAGAGILAYAVVRALGGNS